jgi:hypothetical protein
VHAGDGIYPLEIRDGLPIFSSVGLVDRKGGIEMTINLLRQIAGSRLPVTFSRDEDIDGVRMLRAAGLVVAFVPSPSSPLSLSGSPSAAQVLAVTQKGREELGKFSYPQSRPSRWRNRSPQITARRLSNASAPPRSAESNLPH